MRYWKHIPPLKALLALEATARHGSFSRAAEELNVSQSAVSHAVTTAESFLRTRLLDRATRPIGLTVEGERYLATLASCLSQLAAEAEMLQRRRRGNVLTISCNLAVGNYWLLPRLKVFHEAFPNLQVNMVTTYQGLASLSEGIDVAIRFGRGDWSDGTSRLLFKEVIVPVASPDYLARHSAIRTPSDLSAHVLLHAQSVDKSWYDWQQWFQHFGLDGTDLEGPSFDNHLLMMQAALSGRGVALGWIGTATAFLAEGQLVKALDQAIALEEGVHAVVRGPSSAPVACFLDWLADCAAEASSQFWRAWNAG